MSSSPAPQPAPGDPRTPPWLWLLLLLVPALAYASALQNGFVSDDNPVIAHGRLIGSLRNLPQLFLHDALFSTQHGEALAAGMMVDTYRPIPIATFFLEHALWGLRPAPYHATSVLLHALNVLLLFLVGRRLRLSLGAAALAALLFAVHPSICEAVHWVNGRSDPLVVLLFLLIIILYADTALPGAPLTSTAARALRLLLIGLCAFLATLCKETAFVLVPTLLLPALWRGSRAWGRALLGLLPLVLGLVLGLVCRLLVLHRTAAYPSGVAPGFLLRRLLLILRDGLLSLLLPAPRLQPSLFEAYHEVSGGALAGAALLLLLALAGAALVLHQGAFRSDPRPRPQADLFPWALGASLVTLAPVVLLTVEEGWSGWGRYLYPSAPLWCLAAAEALWDRLRPRLSPLWQARLPWLVAAPLALMAAATFLAGPAWRDERAVAEAQIADRPDISVGYSLLAVVEFNAGHPERALPLLQQALERAPYQSKHWSRTAFVLLRLKRREPALQHAERALQLNPGDSEARYVKAVVVLQRGGPGDDEVAARLVAEQLRDTPAEERFWRLIRDVLRAGGPRSPFLRALGQQPLGADAAARLRGLLGASR